MKYHPPSHLEPSLYCDDLSLTSPIHILWEREQYDNPLTEWPNGGFRFSWVLSDRPALDPLSAIEDNPASTYCVTREGRIVWFDELL